MHRFTPIIGGLSAFARSKACAVVAERIRWHEQNRKKLLSSIQRIAVFCQVLDFHWIFDPLWSTMHKVWEHRQKLREKVLHSKGPFRQKNHLFHAPESVVWYWGMNRRLWRCFIYHRAHQNQHKSQGRWNTAGQVRSCTERNNNRASKTLFRIGNKSGFVPSCLSVQQNMQVIVQLDWPVTCTSALADTLEATT